MRLGHPTHQKFKPVVKNALESGFFNRCQLFLYGRAKAKGKPQNDEFYYHFNTHYLASSVC